VQCCPLCDSVCVIPSCLYKGSSIRVNVVLNSREQYHPFEQILQAHLFHDFVSITCHCVTVTALVELSGLHQLAVPRQAISAAAMQQGVVQ
jgi:hypothetical protein